MGGGTSKPSQNPNFDGNEDDYDDEEGQQTQQNKPVSSYRQNQSQNYARPSQNYGSTRTQGKPVNRPPPQEEEYDDQDQGEEQDQDEEEEEVEEEMQQTPINRKPAPRQNAGISNSQRQGMNYNSSKSKPAYQSPMNGGYRQTKNNVVSGKEQFNEMEEDLPKFSQFVKVIKSPIPYPMDPEALLTAPLAKGFEFTNNTNVFNVFEEERLALVPRSEMLKPFMVLKEVLNNEWDDEDFPSEPESLSKEPKHDMILKKIMWKKISEIAPAQGFAIIYDTNRPDCIIPGKLNNRAFQSALSILAETEHYLPSVFPEFNETSNSVLSLWLNHTGEWKVYTVDEKFPYDKETMNWAFTHSKNETWVLILEKAFAKMYGTYFALELGHTAHFIHDITGAPYRYFYFDDPEECWKFLNSFDLAATTVVAMNKAQKYKVHDEDDLSKAPSYAYTVLDLREVRTSKGLEKIVKLRDPWPQKTWGGDWSNQSKKWTKPIMDLLCPDGLFDDEFWIGIPDFVKYYGMGFSFKLFTSYQHSSIRLKHSYERNHSLILMNIQSECNMFLQVNQPDHRHFLSFDEPYSYSLVKMMVVEVDAWLKPRRFITGLYNKGRDCEVECRLMPGDYLVFIEVDWEQNLNREIVFSTYGEINAVLYEINCLEEKLTLVRRFLHQYFKSSAEYEEVMDYGNFGDKRVKRYIDYVYGYLCFYYQNKSEMYGLTEKVKMESIFGLQITQPFTDDFEFDVNLRANSDFLVVYETTPDGQMAYHYKHRSWSYLYPDGPEDIVKKLVMTKAKKILKRKMDGKDIDVFVHIYAFNGGYCFYYNNKTKYIYRERLGLDLFNLVGFDNSEQTYFEIKLEPKEDFVLKFKVKDPLQPFSYASRVSYKINQTREQEENDDVEEEEIPQNQPNQSPPKGAPMMFPKPVRDMLMKHVKNYDDSQKIVRPLKYQQQQNQPIRQQEPNIADRR